MRRLAVCVLCGVLLAAGGRRPRAAAGGAGGGAPGEKALPAPVRQIYDVTDLVTDPMDAESVGIGPPVQPNERSPAAMLLAQQGQQRQPPTPPTEAVPRSQRVEQLIILLQETIDPGV